MTGAAQWVWAVGALVAVLALMLAAGRVMRSRFGAMEARGSRRVAVVEVTSLDSRRRAVLLRVDGREALVLTGGPSDVVVGWL